MLASAVRHGDFRTVKVTVRTTNDDYLDMTGYQEARLSLYTNSYDTVPVLTLSTSVSGQAIFADRLQGALEFYLTPTMTLALSQRQYFLFVTLLRDTNHVYTVHQSTLQIT